MSSSENQTSEKLIRKPDWLKIKLPTGQTYREIRNIVDHNNLNTICESANCPNMGECWGFGTATFMILGKVCTRSCSFCSVSTGKPEEIDWGEPVRVAEAVRLMRVQHCVITSVSRDELSDEGANIWAATIGAVKSMNTSTTVEALIPDFKGKKESLQNVINSNPDIVGHNLETISRLYKVIRPQAKYERSLDVIRQLKKAGMITKSGIMVGMGEKKEEVYTLMDHLLRAGCDILTIGQYLQPTKAHYKVVEFIHPDIFKNYKEVGLQKGFRHVESGPLVRSSYLAEKYF